MNSNDPKPGNMIARIWHGWTRPGSDADAYEALLKPELLPGLNRVPGFRGSYLLRRESGEEVEFITIILWESLDALKAYAGVDFETSIVPEERRRYLTRHDARAVHFEVRSIADVL